MNSYTSIDLATWKRRGTFEYYRTFQNQLFNITLEFPAAELYRYARRNRLSFFLLTLHAILRAVNSVPQFRQRIVDGGQVIEFEHVAALTPIMTPEEEFVMALTEYAPSFAEFRGQAEAAVAAVFTFKLVSEVGGAVVKELHGLSAWQTVCKIYIPAHKGVQLFHMGQPIYVQSVKFVYELPLVFLELFLAAEVLIFFPVIELRQQFLHVFARLLRRKFLACHVPNADLY